MPVSGLMYLIPGESDGSILAISRGNYDGSGIAEEAIGLPIRWSFSDPGAIACREKVVERFKVFEIQTNRGFIPAM